MRYPIPLLALLLTCLLPFSQAKAHQTLTSAVLLDIHSNQIRAELQLPVDQLRLALPGLTGEGDTLVHGVNRIRLQDYLQQHMYLWGENKNLLEMDVDDLRSTNPDGVPHIQATIRFRNTSHSTLADTAFNLHYDVILHRVVSHKIYVSLRSDFRRAIFADQPQMLDVLRYQHSDLQIERGDASLWRGFRALVVHGMEHISSGSDHLLFLLCLLLPAPLLNLGGSWRGHQGNRACWMNILKIVTAFTLGHSLTLAWVVLSQAQVPARPVEVMVAASILVSAVHALKPVLERYTVAVASGFGLLHGLAFSSAIAGMGLDLQATVTALLGFNLGIEIAQLLIVAAVVPCLIIISRQQARWYTTVRVGGAGFAIIASVGWISERMGLGANPFNGLVDISGWHGVWSYGVLAAVAAWAWWRQPAQAQPAVSADIA